MRRRKPAICEGQRGVTWEGKPVQVQRLYKVRDRDEDGNSYWDHHASIAVLTPEGDKEYRNVMVGELEVAK